MSQTLILQPVDLGRQHFVDALYLSNETVESLTNILEVNLDSNMMEAGILLVEDAMLYRSYLLEGQTLDFINGESIVEAESIIGFKANAYNRYMIDEHGVHLSVHFTIRHQTYLYSPKLNNYGIKVFRVGRYIEDFKMSRYDFEKVDPTKDSFHLQGYTFPDTVKSSPFYGSAVWNDYIYLDSNEDGEYAKVSSAYYGGIIDLSSWVIPIEHNYENIVTVRETTRIGFNNGIKILNSMVDATTVVVPTPSPFDEVEIDLGLSVTAGLSFEYDFSPEQQRAGVTLTPVFNYSTGYYISNETVEFNTARIGLKDFSSIETGEFHYSSNGGVVTISSSVKLEPLNFTLYLNKLNKSSYHHADSIFSTEGAIIILPHHRTDDTLTFEMTFRYKATEYIYPFEMLMVDFEYERHDYNGATIEGDQIVETSGVLSLRFGGTRTYPVGLFRDVFIQSDEAPHLQLTAHLPSNLGTFRVLPTRLEDVEAGTPFEVFSITPHSFGFWKVDTTDVGLIVPYRSPMIPLNVAPYVRITQDSTGDYITFGLGFLGGQILHMHKDGWMDYYQEDYLFEHEAPPSLMKQLVDPILGSSAALKIASLVYQRHARVLYGVNQGEMWDDIYIENAKDYLVNYQKEAKLFDGMPYSPTVVSSIIKNLRRGLVNKDIFDTPDLGSFSLDVGDRYYIEDERKSLLYIYEDVNSIAEGGCTYRYMSRDDHVLVTNKEEPFPIHVSSDIFKMSTYMATPILEFCLGGAGDCEPFRVDGVTVEESVTMGSPTLVNGITEGLARISTAEDIVVEPSELGDVYIGGVDMEGGILIQTLKRYNPIFTEEISYRVEMPYEYQGISADGSYHSSLYTLPEISIPLRYQALYLDDTGVAVNNAINISSKYTVFFPENIETPVSRMSYKNNIFYPKAVEMKYSTIWLKVFPRNESDTAIAESDLLRFFVTKEKFALRMFMPYKFISLLAKSNSGATKSSSRDIKEKKIIETDDPFGEEPEGVRKPSDRLCGTSRNITYLEMQAHGHMFSPEDNTWFGTYSWEEKERFMAGFVVELERVVTRKGAVLRDADALKRTLTELTLSRVEELSVVENWRIEDFKLNAEDVGLEANNGEAFNDIDSAFRAALKAATNRLGDDGARIESEQNANMFPAFPERPRASDQLATDKKVQQFIILEEPPKE